MWPIFLKVLSIIGIVLACILGVIILLLLLILLCPITYRADADAHDNKYTAKVKIKYLFGLVRAGFDYPEPGILYVKALCFTVFDTSDSDDSTDEPVGKNKKLKFAKNTKSSNSTNETDETINSSENHNKDIDNSVNNKSVKNKTVNNKTTNNKSVNNKTDDNKRKIHNPIYYIKKGWENFRYKVVTKVQYIIKDIKYYLALWEHDDTQALVRKVKKRGLKILKIIAPNKGHVDMVFGTGSPDTTGQIYGVCSAVFFRWPKTFKIIPDFENKIIEGSLSVSGWFNLFSIVIQALPIVFSKKLKLTRARFEAHGDKKDISKAKAEKKHERILKELEEEYTA